METAKRNLALGAYLLSVTIASFLAAIFVDFLLGGGGLILAMAALTADRVTQQKTPGLKSFPVKDATKIYAGSLVAVQADGHAVPASDAASLKVVGVAQAQVDNSAGADGDLSVNAKQGIFLFAATSITQAMVGQMMYVVDDQTFDDAVGTNAVKAGILVEFVSTTKGWIRIEEPMGVGCVVADAGATYTAAEQTLINNMKALINKWL